MPQHQAVLGAPHQRPYETEGHRFESCRARFESPGNRHFFAGL
jgi:hypothetical protein